jgi:hypothetical protein
MAYITPRSTNFTKVEPTREKLEKSHVRSTVKGPKRERDHEDISEQGDVTLAVLRLMDSRQSDFLNTSREQARAHLMELFWVFLLRDKATPKLSLVESSD